MSLPKCLESKILFAFMISLFLAVPISPAPPPPQAGPWVISGAAIPQDGTTQDCTTGYGFTFGLQPGGGTLFGAANPNCTYSTPRQVGDGAIVTGNASVLGYLGDTETTGPIHNDTILNFYIYSSMAWVSGSVTDALNGAMITSQANGLSVIATSGPGGTAFAHYNGNTFNFGGVPGHPFSLGGLGVSRPANVLQGPGQATWVITVQANGYSTASIQVTLTSGQILTQNVVLFPASSGATPPPVGAGPQRDCHGTCGQPIDLTTGNTYIPQQDYSLPGLGGGISLTRTWNSLWPTLNPPVTIGMFGESWRSTYEEQLVHVGTRSDTLEYWRGDGSVWFFLQDPVSLVYSVTSPPDQHTIMTFDSSTMLYTMTFLDGSKRQFNQITGQNQGGLLTAIVDRNGNTTTVNYTGGLISSVTDAAGRVLTFNYGTGAQSSLVANISDAVNTFSTYTYDSSLHLTKVAYPDGSTLNFAFDTSNNITSVTDLNSKVIEAQTYDTQHRGLTSSRAQVGGIAQETVTVAYTSSTQSTVMDSKNNVTTYNFQANAAQRYVTQIAGSGCSTCGGRGNSTFTYGGSGNRTAVQDANNNTTNYTYDGSGNVLTRSITVNGSPVTWTYTYNGLGEVLTAQDPLGNQTVNTYDSKGNLLTTKTPSPDGVSQGFTTTFTYDTGGLGELKTVKDPLNNVTTIAYFSTGLIQTITDAQSNATNFTYSPRGNRLTAVDALNKTTGFTYDPMNRLTKITYPDLTTTQFAYDTRGRRTTVTDGNGKVTTYAYDDADRLTSVTDAATNLTGYGYDTESNLTSITDAKNHTTSFLPDSLGRVTTVTFPSTLTETYTYDGVGNLTSKKDRKGNTISYTYDPLNRLTLKTYPDTTTVAYTYDAASRLTQVIDPTGTYALAYDGLGRLKQSTTTYSFLTGHNLSVSYTYDAASNRATMTDAEGGVTTYTPDTLNRLATLAPPAAISSGSFGFGYDALSRRTSLTRPSGLNTTYAYDTLSRLTSITHQKSGTTLDGASYAYDSAGNRSSRTPLPGGTASNFTYDPIYELTKVMQGTSTTEQYTYDQVGNRLTSLTVSSFTYNLSNEMTTQGATTFTWDNNGNLATRVAAATSTWTWDFENRLLQTVSPNDTPSTVNYKYDPFGRRIYKSSTAGTTIYVYDGDNIIEEVDANGNSVARYAQGLGIDEPLAMLRSSATSFYQADGLGSITSLSDTTGALAATYTYDSFGKKLTATGTITNPFRFTGRELDTETGQYYNRARYYLPFMGGRFISEDPISFRSRQINFYTYVADNPVTWLDPFGLKVYRCKRKADFRTFGAQSNPSGLVAHQWIKTDTKEAGLGAAGAGVPGQGGTTSDFIGTPTTINDHSGESKAPGATCEEVPDTDEACVNKELEIGKYVGPFFLPPTINCQSLVTDIFQKCSTRPRPTPRIGTRPHAP